MTIKRVAAAAACRGCYFSGMKDGMFYIMFLDNAPVRFGSYFQADTLQGMYNMIMRLPKIYRTENEYWEDN